MDAPTCWRPGLAKTRFAVLILAARPPQRVAASGICAFDKKCPVVNLVLRWFALARETGKISLPIVKVRQERIQSKEELNEYQTS